VWGSRGTAIPPALGAGFSDFSGAFPWVLLNPKWQQAKETTLEKHNARKKKNRYGGGTVRVRPARCAACRRPADSRHHDRLCAITITSRKATAQLRWRRDPYSPRTRVVAAGTSDSTARFDGVVIRSG
jgi:hypothetical protein